MHERSECVGRRVGIKRPCADREMQNPAETPGFSVIAPRSGQDAGASPAPRLTFPYVNVTLCLGLQREGAMTRRFIDCREFPSESNCSVTIMADTEDELLAAAAQHAVAVHGHEDTPELRAGLRGVIRSGIPPEHLHRK